MIMTQNSWRALFGKPLPGTKISIITGRLAFSGPGLMLGYYGQIPLDNKAFITNDLATIVTVMDIYTLLVE